MINSVSSLTPYYKVYLIRIAPSNAAEGRPLL